jgi:hypothetical protein
MAALNKPKSVYAIGIVLALAVSVFARSVGLDRDRACYPTVLVVVAPYCVLFAVMAVRCARWCSIDCDDDLCVRCGSWLQVQPVVRCRRVRRSRRL